LSKKSPKICVIEDGARTSVPMNFIEKTQLLYITTFKMHLKMALVSLYLEVYIGSN
jgi:hypothetical protein